MADVKRLSPRVSVTMSRRTLAEVTALREKLGLASVSATLAHAVRKLAAEHRIEVLESKPEK